MRHLLVAIDFSEQTPRLIATAKELATSVGCPVRLFHVLEESDEDSRASNERQLEEMAEKLKKDGIQVTSVVESGPIVTRILEELQKQDVDHIIMGTHGRSGLMEVFLGSVSKGVIQNSALPITLLPRY
jgi:nucleotide-binding universal stress UspA family protein